MSSKPISVTVSRAPETRATRPKAPVFVLLGGALLTIAFFSLTHPIHDFVEYWTTSHLLISHGNPYSLAEVFREEKRAGFEQSVPIMLLSPPWILPLLAPLGLSTSYGWGWVGWLSLLLFSVALSSRMLMDVYFKELRIPEISDTGFYRSLFAFTFYPVLLCLRYVQTAPLMLLGLAGFLYFDQKKKPAMAGTLLALTLVKPQLLYLIWIALVLDAFQRRRWKAVVAAFGVTAVLSTLAIWLDPQVFRQYRELAQSPYFQAYASGITAGIRKLFGGIGTFWIQFVPPVIGLGWFVFYWRKHSKRWSWTEQLPMIITMSVVTSAYGWLFDQTLLVLPVIAVAAKWAHSAGRLPAKIVLLYTALNSVLMILMPIPTLALLPAPIFLGVLLTRSARAQEVAKLKNTGPILPAIAKGGQKKSVGNSYGVLP
jgi:hypothetical protein